ncbi:tetratricopeptide repeat protein [Ancylomarina sp. DW003]|nr:tetratricopeptide repeat protein [Ancylomarina sp. DW003]MDE5423079.1 tetratricopeptide repeat protein [Ancylomarina sp. DW003]
MLKKTVAIIIMGFAILSCKDAQKSPNSNKTEIAIQKPSFVSEMNKITEEKSIDEAMVWFQANKGLNKYGYDESELNQLGYNLLYELKRPEDAIKVFRLSVTKFPNSANAYDSFAEAYLTNGDYDLSIENYRKSIKLGNTVQFHLLGFLQSKPYSESQIPNDTTKLFITKGNWENDTAFVYVQGGPDIDLQINEKDALHLMPNADKLLKIYPVQSQILNPDLLITNPILTPEQSAKENLISAEILNRTVLYLKDKGKKVFLIGHSYGSSICLEYLNSKNNLTDKTVIMGLDLDEDISSWNKLKTGEYIRWENGENPISKTVFAWVPNDYPIKSSFDRIADNLTALVKSNMQKNYTKLLKQSDFDKLISVFAKNDEANGRKSKKEIEFLKSKNVTAIEVEGNHHSMLTAEFMKKLYENLISGKPFKTE